MPTSTILLLLVLTLAAVLLWLIHNIDANVPSEDDMLRQEAFNRVRHAWRTLTLELGHPPSYSEFLDYVYPDAGEPGGVSSPSSPESLPSPSEDYDEEAEAVQAFLNNVGNRDS